MRDTYSLYEAKAKLSAIVRRVREGHPAIVTLHGVPVAEIRPLAEDEGQIDRRMQVLADKGILVRPAEPREPLRLGEKKPGALKRFLDDRDG